MADGTLISWTDATWNVVTGCSVKSAACTNCYAMRLAGTRLVHHPSRAGLTTMSKAGPVWNGEVRFNAEWLDQPRKWTRPRTVFVVAHGDLFYEAVPQSWLDQIFARMVLAPQHTYQLLTKRPNRMRAYLTDPHVRARIAFHAGLAQDGRSAAEMARGRDLIAAMTDGSNWPLRQVWTGTTVEDQRAANERVPDLLATPSALRWVSAEPLLGLTDFTRIDLGERDAIVIGEDGEPDRPTKVRLERNALLEGIDGERIDLIVAGGESGPGARPTHPDWLRQIRDHCAYEGVTFHFKQWGAWIPQLDREREDPDWRADYKFLLNDDKPNIAWLNLNGGRGFHGDRFHIMRRVGTKAAGFELDGKVHRDLPARGA